MDYGVYFNDEDTQLEVGVIGGKLTISLFYPATGTLAIALNREELQHLINYIQSAKASVE